MMHSSFERVGHWLFGLSLAAMGGFEVWRGEALPGLHPLPDAADTSLIRTLGALLLVPAVLSLAPGLEKRVRFALSAYWMILAALAFAIASTHPGDMTAWVSAAQAAVFACAALGSRWPETARLAFGAMLLLFGAIHVTHTALIASLIPHWIPAPALWPWLTGGAQMIAGVALLTNRLTAWAALAVAGMFVSWLALVHAARLISSPDSLFEWTFALTAAALAGAALQIAGRARIAAACAGG